MCTRGNIKQDNSSSDESVPSDAGDQWWRTAATPAEMAAATAGDAVALTPRVRVVRELERLAMVAPEGLDDLRHRLVAYRAGDLWVPTGGLDRDQMEVPAAVTVLLVGAAGAGKSSLVNLMYSVLGRAGIIPFAQTSGSPSKSEATTKFLEEHNVLRSKRSGFCIYDSRGFEINGVDQSHLADLAKWMVEGIHHNQLCWRPGDDLDCQMMATKMQSNKFVKRKVNCAIVVADMAELYDGLKNGDSKALEATKQVFCFPALKKGNQNPILVLTHGDKLQADERIDARVKICKFLGISETSGVYDIVCLTEHGVVAEESDPVTAYVLTEVVYRALLVSDMSYSPKQNKKDKAMLVVHWFLSLLASVFAFLARVFSNLGHKHYKQL